LYIDNGLNNWPDDIEPEMQNPDKIKEQDDEYKQWLPIPSTVTNAEIEDLEKQLNYKLPDRYKIYLQYKHFYELYIGEAQFTGQEIRGWRRNLVDMAFDGYPKEFLIDKGYIPFAHWSDWGLLCFDTNKPCINFDYPIVLWDHERWDTFEPYAANFYELLLKLDAEEIKNNEG
jgi:hypothetical protein